MRDTFDDSRDTYAQITARLERECGKYALTLEIMRARETYVARAHSRELEHLEKGACKAQSRNRGGVGPNQSVLISAPSDVGHDLRVTSAGTRIARGTEHATVHYRCDEDYSWP